jgi:hypothetical protein
LARGQPWGCSRASIPVRPVCCTARSRHRLDRSVHGRDRTMYGAADRCRASLHRHLRARMLPLSRRSRRSAPGRQLPDSHPESGRTAASPRLPTAASTYLHMACRSLPFLNAGTSMCQAQRPPMMKLCETYDDAVVRPFAVVTVGLGHRRCGGRRADCGATRVAGWRAACPRLASPRSRLYRRVLIACGLGTAVIPARRLPLRQPHCEHSALAPS